MIRLREVLLVGFLAFAPGCELSEPTYVDISPVQLEAIADNLGTTVEQLFREDRVLLKTEISEEIGLKVDAIHIPDVNLPSSATPAEIVEAMKASGVVAQIEPATEAAVREVASEAMQNPASKDNWISGAIGGAGVLLAGALGLRGRKRRREVQGA